MSKKIVVITGSPRVKGNSMTLANAFIETAVQNGHIVKRFDAARLQVGGCKACNACYKTGKACAFDDDFNLIAPEIEAADVILFVAPVYWYTFPAQIKAVIDKLYSIEAQRDTAGKSCGLISCCADDTMDTFEGMQFAYRKTIELLKWTSVGEVLIPGVSGTEDVLKTDGIEKAILLANQISLSL